MRLIKALLWHVMPLNWIGAAIGAAASVAGGVISSRQQGSSNKQAREWEQAWRMIDYEQDQTVIQRRVADAKAAGLHPLFALGAPGKGSTYSSASYPSTGSAMGQGIAQAGQAIQKGIRGYKMQELALAEEGRRQESHEALMRKSSHDDWMDMMERDSILKRAEANANSGARMTPDGAIVVPAPMNSSITRNPLPADRPTRQEPNVNAPMWSTMTTSQGEKFKVLSELAQADELNQVLIAAQAGFSEFVKLGNALARAGIIDPAGFGRDAYTFFRNMGRKVKRPYHTRNRK